MVELSSKEKLDYVKDHIISKGFTGNKNKLEDVFKFLYGDYTVTQAGKSWPSWQFRYERYQRGEIDNDYLFETVKNREGYRLVETEWVLADAQIATIG